jgi:hypothetical protein
MMVRSIKLGPQSAEGVALFTKMVGIVANDEMTSQRKNTGKGQTASMTP